MSDPGTVWLVVSGEYSDYTVWCAFETETLARDYIAEIGAVAGGHDPYSVSLNGDIIGERLGLRVERCQLWSTMPIVRITERHPATERDPAEMEIEPGIEMSEEPERYGPPVPYVPDPPPPTPEEFGAKALAWAEQHNARLRNRPHVS
jgi:hypothetical protein